MGWKTGTAGALLALACSAKNPVHTTDSSPPTDSAAARETGSADTGPTSDPPAPLRVLLANVGNLDEATGGPCPAAPYHGSTCSLAQESAIAQSIAALAPDVAILLEVLDADDCAEETWSGDPDLLCTGAPDRQPYQQARRLLGAEYTISCDGRSHRSCIGLRISTGSMAQCEAGALCLAGSETAPHPAVCGDLGRFTSVSSVDAVYTREQGGLAAGQIIAAHALNATTEETDPCRAAHYEQAFVGLPGGAPVLIAGDMNMDPYRFPDVFPSAEYWHTQVGEDARFQALNVDADPPTPTWLDLATLDYVLSDGLVGKCTVLNTDDRLDGALATMDHRGVLCSLRSR
jgi:hypothetical protein